MPTKPLSLEEQDAADALLIVQSAQIAVEALESLRSRMVGKRDATSATGHLLAALVAAGGSLREYDRRHVWALRHAVGGESHGFASPHDAAAHVLAGMVHALRPARSEDEATRQKNAQVDMLALAKILQASEHSIEAMKNVEQAEQAAALSKAQADKAAHDRRLAAGAPPAVSAPAAPAPKPAPKAAPKGKASRDAAAPEGDYVLPGSADGPDGNPFPTTPVG